MKRVDFTEKIILTLGFLVEAMVILLIFTMLASCRVKKQEEIKRSEKTEVRTDIKTSETETGKIVDVVSRLEVKNINRDFSARVEWLKFSEPDSSGHQYVAEKTTVDISDKSKIGKQQETVDSADHRFIKTETVRGNSKIREEIKADAKIKTEADSKFWTNFLLITGMVFLTGIAAIIYKKFK